LDVRFVINEKMKKINKYYETEKISDRKRIRGKINIFRQNWRRYGYCTLPDAPRKEKINLGAMRR
jgi:hypothetical protein